MRYPRSRSRTSRWNVVAGERLERARGGIGEPHARRVGAGRSRDLPEQGSQERAQLDGRRQGTADVEQPLHLAQLLGRLPGQIGVLHRQSQLGRHALDETDLGGIEGAAGLPPHEEDPADRLSADEGRREEHRPRADRRQEREVEARVTEEVRRPDGSAFHERLAKEIHGKRGLDERGEEALRHVVARHRHEGLPGGIEGVDPHHVGDERAAHLPRHAPHGLLDGQRPGKHSGHAEERLSFGRLALAAGDLLLELDDAGAKRVELAVGRIRRRWRHGSRSR